MNGWMERARDYNILIIIILFTSPLPFELGVYIMMMVNEFTGALWCVDAFHSNLSFGLWLDWIHRRITRRESIIKWDYRVYEDDFVSVM